MKQELSTKEIKATDSLSADNCFIDIADIQALLHAEEGFVFLIKNEKAYRISKKSKHLYACEKHSPLFEIQSNKL